MVSWEKSSYSGGQDGPDCVEVAVDNGVVLLRESDEPSHVLCTTPAGLAALLRKVKALSSGQP